MNERRESTGISKPDGFSSPQGTAQVCGMDHNGNGMPVLSQSAAIPTVSRKNGVKPLIKRDQALLKDSLFIVKRNDIHHVISENGEQVQPGSSSVLDAYVVPLCLERAASAGIPTCEWGISQVYVPLPAILYGLNYFSTTLDYFIINDNEKAKEVVRHITNNGKYPFCYQKYPEGSQSHTCIAIVGRTGGACTTVAEFAQKIYELFKIPLVNMVFIKTGTTYTLSSLSPTRYAQLSDGERALLTAYLTHQEFL
ncbi:MAG: hypothetical protein NTW33_10025 [Methanoregula sp.]|nr:hypothetical protein [Methanoregula sp.]